MKKLIPVLLSASLLFLSGCSSAPKRVMQINNVYKNTALTIENANSALIAGNYPQAEKLLDTAYRQAISIDNYDLLTTICLSYVSYYLSFETPDLQMAEKYQTEADFNAGFAENKTKQEALCKLSYVRIELAKGNTNYDFYIATLNMAQPSLKSDPYNIGVLSSVTGDVYKTQKDYIKAEAQYLNSVKIFTDNRYLGEIGITWYKIAQVRSLAENKTAALEALQNAIKYDRDAENSIALGTDYYAMGLILSKGNPTPAELSQANYYFTHSAQIFDSIGLTKQAEKSRMAAGK